jgi:hypothetical protein
MHPRAAFSGGHFLNPPGHAGCMGAFKYVMCWIVVMTLSFLPVIPPMSTAIVTFFGVHVLHDSYYFTITFNANLMPMILTICIMLFGSFLMYCVYRDHECSWRKERVKQDLFVPDFFDAKAPRS